MAMIFTPMRGAESVVILAGNTGGFDVRGCPNSAELGDFIRRACNAHDKLVAALQEARDAIESEYGRPCVNLDAIDAVLAEVGAE